MTQGTDNGNAGTDPTADDLTGKAPGERIQIIRERTGKSRAVVAGLVGRSEEWLRAVEKGRRQPPRIDMLVRLADVLGVHSLAELTGETDLLMTTTRRAMHPVVVPIREAIESVELAALDPSVTATELAERVERAWRLWHTSDRPRTDAGAMLPSIIRDGRRALRAFDGDSRREAAAALAGGYALAEQVLSWVSDAPLLWMSADRCVAAAQIADRPNILAASAWVMGNVWRSTGREQDAWNLAQDAVKLLEPRLDGADAEANTARALWGSCQLHSAITAARVGREGDALRCLDEAMRMTSVMDSYVHPWTLFARPNAELTAVSVNVDLHKSGGALEAASIVDPQSIPSKDRQSRLYLETARAYGQREDWLGALHVLQTATSVSEECMRCHPLSRGLAGELVSRGGRMIEREARALAGRLGVPA